MRRGSLVALALVLLLPGCGHERAGSGSASLWITRDRGATVLLVRTVPAGLTAMEALDRKADVSKRYSGRFVQSIEGVEGDISKVVGGATDKPVPSAPKHAQPKGAQPEGGHTSSLLEAKRRAQRQMKEREEGNG